MDKLGQSINFDVNSELNRLIAGMAGVDLITDKHAQKAAERHQAVRDARIAAKVHDWVADAGEPLKEALTQVGYQIEMTKKIDLVSYAMNSGDLVVLGMLMAEAIRTELQERAEDE